MNVSVFKEVFFQIKKGEFNFQNVLLKNKNWSGLMEEIDRSNQVKRRKILSNESVYTKDRRKVAGKRVIKLETVLFGFLFV